MRKMRLAVFISLLWLATIAAVPETAATAGEDAKLLAYLDRAWRAQLTRDPTLATQLGIGDPQGHWTAVSDERDSEDERFSRRELRRLARELKFEALSPSGQLDYRLYERTLQDQIRAVDYHRGTYFFTRNTADPYLDIPQTLIASHRITSAQDARRYIERLRGLNEILEDALAGTIKREAQGIVLPAFNFEDIARNSRELITGRPCDDSTTDQSLWADFQKKIAVAPLATDERRTLLVEARRAIHDSVCSAYERFAASITALGRGRTRVDGLWSLPNGEALYRDAIYLHTSVEANLEELHQTGLREVERIEAQLLALKPRLGYDGNVSDMLKAMRRDPRFLLPQSEAGRSEYLAMTQQVIDRAQQLLPQLFSRIPSRPIVVRPVEAAREGSLGTAAFYEPPAGGVGPGVFYIGLADMAQRPTWEIEATTYHEAVPGHHFQVSLANEMPELSEFRRHYRNGAYQEGWALYAEGLGAELGGYTNDYSRAARYQLELLRAVRVVVETGFHFKRWSWEQGAAYLVDHQGMTPQVARQAMTRYIVWPGQGVSYKMGELEIVRLRRKAEQALGARFDVRGFHSSILDGGALPFTLLEQRVDEWIEQVQHTQRRP